VVSAPWDGGTTTTARTTAAGAGDAGAGGNGCPRSTAARWARWTRRTRWCRAGIAALTTVALAIDLPAGLGRRLGLDDDHAARKRGGAAALVLLAGVLRGHHLPGLARGQGSLPRPVLHQLMLNSATSVCGRSTTTSTRSARLRPDRAGAAPCGTDCEPSSALATPTQPAGTTTSSTAGSASTRPRKSAPASTTRRPRPCLLYSSNDMTCAGTCVNGICRSTPARPIARPSRLRGATSRASLSAASGPQPKSRG